MVHTLPYKQGHLRYQDQGQGFPVILLHGFMESLDVWDDLSEKLSRKYRVIAIDLPGHGKSSVLEPVHTMDLMAESVKFVMDSLNIDQAAIVGHSMGGYTALQLLKDYPERVKCLVLLHSTPFPDTEERKKARDEIIMQIKHGKKVQFAKDFVKQTFAEENLEKLVRSIGFLKIIAINTSNDGIIAALEGMKLRPSYKDVIEQTDKPVLWILGKKDKFIPVDVYKSLDLKENVKIAILEKSGHQGYIEEFDKVLDLLDSFFAGCNN